MFHHHLIQNRKISFNLHLMHSSQMIHKIVTAIPEIISFTDHLFMGILSSMYPYIPTWMRKGGSLRIIYGTLVS